MIDTIFLDMDGVCCDWWNSAAALHGVKVPEKGPLPYWLEELVKKPKEHINALVGAQSSDWWANLPEYPWFQAMYNLLTKFPGVDVVFLTASGHFPNAPNGKVKWMQDRFGPSFDKFVITRHKEYCASPRAILIDDSPEMIEKFKKRGGHTVLFPQRWNKNIHRIDNPLHHVSDRVHDIISFYQNHFE